MSHRCQVVVGATVLVPSHVVHTLGSRFGFCEMSERVQASRCVVDRPPHGKWHWRHGVFNHGQFDCLPNIFRLTTKQAQKLHITEFCENHISTVVSPHKWVGNAGIAIDIMTVTQHIVAQYGDISLSTLTRVMACCLTEPNHYLNQFWLIIGKVKWGDTSAINY